MSLQRVRDGFDATGLPAELSTALIDAYEEAKRRYHLADHRPNAIEGGRFCEAAFRILDHVRTGTFAPVGTSINTNIMMRRLESDTSMEETVRFHLPRALRVIYDVRNKRDIGHLGDGTINPNLMDATLVVNVMDWVMAEFVRMFHSVNAAQAQAMIAAIVTRKIPVIEEINGQPVCSTTMPVGDLALVFLYRAGQAEGLSLGELQRQMRHKDRSNLTKVIRVLDAKRLALRHPETKQIHITTAGMASVERRRLLHPAA